MKNIFLCLCLCLFLSSPASAIKFSGGSFDSSLHIGAVFGPGVGVGLGIDAGIPMGDFELGAEIEQIMSNNDFEVNIDARRIGLLLRYAAIPGVVVVGFHTGAGEFSISKDAQFKDFSSGKSVDILSGDIYHSSYAALSLDYYFGDVIITPKIMMNYLEGGSLLEFDLNLGKNF